VKLSRVIEEYVDGELMLQGKAPSTRRCYLTDLRQFAAFCRSGGQVELSEVEKSDVEGFLHGQMRQGLSQNTVRRRGFVLKGFFRWAEGEGYCEDPARRVAVPKYRARFPYCPSEEEVKRMLDNCHDPVARVIIATLFYTGIRIGELTSLQLDDVDLDRGVLKVCNGKGGRDRLIPLSRPARKILETYRVNVRPTVGTDNFFATRTGKLSDVWAGRLIRQEKERQGIDSPLTAHSLRHAFATHLYRKGCDLRKLQKLLGHSSLQTLEVYVHLNTEDLQDSVELLG